MNHPVTAVLIGAGLRGADAYAAYALAHPNELSVVAVAEPDAARRGAVCRAHHIPESRAFSDWRALLFAGKIADCAMVCTQDRMHLAPVVAALELGYDVLCEKPMSTDKAEILSMAAAAERTGRRLIICHTLRYAKFFTRIKEALDEGRIGRLVSISAAENVGYYHAAHSFVRGNWRSERDTSPMILQKCCHDMDILRWLVGADCVSVGSYGALMHFTAANRPSDAPDYCLDGCPHRESCPYYAPRFYLTHDRRADFYRAVAMEPSDANLLAALAKGPYGRCVYACDNTVVDHQTVNLLFDNGVTADFSMCDFTSRCERRIHLMGTRGDMTGNMEEGVIRVNEFASGESTEYHLHTDVAGHNGGDGRMMRAFVRAVAGEAAPVSDAATSVMGHMMALAAEESRLTGKMVDMADFLGV